MRTIAKLGTVLLGALSSTASAQSVTVGTVGVDDNCLPFVCSANFTDVMGYQQVFAGSLFAAPVDITAIGFFGRSEYAPANYTITLSTTTRAVGGLSTNLASNVTGPETLVFGGALSGAFLDPTFVLPTPFTFDPAQGNLLLSMVITGYQVHPSIQPLVSADVTPDCSRAFDTEFAGFPNDVADATCLVTRLDYAAVAAVPEPATVALTAIGLLALGGATARRRRAS